MAGEIAVSQRGARPVAAVRSVRAVVVVIALGLWFLTQHLIGSREFPGDGGAGEVASTVLTRADGFLSLTAPANRWLHDHAAAADVLLIASSAVIDVLALFLIARSIFGASLRPFLALILLFALRQAVQAFCALPAPEGMIWRHPGFPSLLVTYGVANDFFFSGHTALAVLGAVEVARIPRRGFTLLGLAVALFEITTVLALRAHYTMDVFAGAVAALLVAGLGTRLAPRVDARIAGASLRGAA